MRLRTCGIHMLFPVLLIFVSSVSAIENSGTIILSSGEEFHNVVFDVNPEFKTLTIVNKEHDKEFLFSEIVTVRNENGTDISEMALGTETPKLNSENWKSKDSREFKEASKKKWNLALSLNLGLNAPAGDYYRDTKAGLGFGGDIHIALTNHLALSGTVEHTGIDFDDNFGFVYPANISVLKEEHSMSVTRILAGIEYYELTSRASNSRNMWYLNTMIGVIAHKLKSDVVIRELSGNTILGGVVEDTQTQFAMNLGGGIIQMVSPSVGINIGLDFDFVFTDVFRANGERATDVGGHVFSLQTGLVYFLR